MEVNILYLLALVVILVLLYRKISYHFDYFHDKPIPSMAANPLFGSTGPMMLKKFSFSDFIKHAYDKYPGVKVFGMFDSSTRMFVIRDAELIKKVTVKDFDHFMDRRPVFGENKTDSENILLSKTLVQMTDQRWREMRAILSPAFTGSKMRAMFDLIAEYSDRMVGILKGEASTTGYLDYEMKDCYSRIANDIIATCAFGLEVESVKDRDNEFFTVGKQMMNFNRLSMLVKVLAYRFVPGLMTKLEIDVFDKEHIQYFSKIIKTAVQTRESHGIVRPDMIHLLMQARKGVLKHQQETAEGNAGFATVEESDVGKSSISRTMTEPEFIAQCLIFFLAGFDTVSSGLTFLSYELAMNQDVQQKLYEEIVETEKQLNGNKLSYDTLQKMKYLDMVVSESLRMWPVPAVDRNCVRDYVLDDGKGLKFTINKGTCVWIPIHGIHRDPKYYPNPERFYPDRFSEANRGSINMTMYLPFGAGPRNCIGSRFALMELKAIMYQLLLNFRIERNEKTQVPLQLVKGFAGMASEGGMHLRLKVRK